MATLNIPSYSRRITYACITLPIRFLRSGDRSNRSLTVSKTVLTVFGRSYGLYDQLLRSPWSVATVSTDSTAGCYGPHGQPYGIYGLYGHLLRLIKAGPDRGGFTSSSAFEGSRQILDYRFLNIGKHCTRLQRLSDKSLQKTVTAPYSAALFIPFWLTVATDRIDRTGDRTGRMGDRA